MGFDPTTVSDGKRALRRLHQSLQSTKPIELVLLDLGLAAMSGPQLLAEMMVRSVPGSPIQRWCG